MEREIIDILILTYNFIQFSDCIFKKSSCSYNIHWSISMSPKREEGVEAVWGFGGRREPRSLLTFILQSSLCTRPLGWWSCNMVVVVVTLLSIQSEKREIIIISFAVAWGSACDKFVISIFQIGCCLSIATSLSHFWPFFAANQTNVPQCECETIKSLLLL